ncbi:MULTISPECIES: acetyl-CoA carboxylase biotin carboxyl carrier protein [Pseudomonas]|jgi:acetyl-CoA carboxylase biotin carboxyl carrier protein|uniref:Biotin carboxyl carrier protein of acetyl-CoA carboxylase n=3 Tax=Pseudomonas TaxID=286 RepID=A0ABY6FHH8_9PSED|nr:MULTISPECIES: acetyl-CoA carboxylase biotin carboxyl carrier protein [Pseudomonas]MCQ2996850.1 acetyl-CoA carboxylase biotin carboxyl carrier protein [Pseudomonas syringae]RMR04315.1 Acetyl-CoA carboxylase biotin carboxyl carrier protein subunit [Pseudomonas savastanoi pv. glycinea]MBC3951350.1 acetyl-CoA carboxylase biotin carboxyl carrier protein [Pseudomonas folii]MCD5972781.1 acetyl-CoA carboxylase biotin carboxyl carrier protein [Pseudomonas quasicaspiana]MCD5980104.1 acetyl-CoA carbox
MDIRKVKKLIELLEESGIDELEIREGEESVRISRHSKTPAQPYYAPAPVAAPVAAPAAPVAAAAEAPSAPKLNGTVVKSPMVGTFYRTPAPGSPAFVEVGKTVKKGDTICIVEAMKMMNHIEAEVSGVIESILVENGQPVEYDQPLFTIV